MPVGTTTLPDTVASSYPRSRHGSSSPLPRTSRTGPIETEYPAIPLRRLVTFGRTDPLHLTERFIERYGVDGYTFVVGSEFDRDLPWEADSLLFTENLEHELPGYDIVYCGMGATLFEALLAGCFVNVISSFTLDFQPALTSEPHFAHDLTPIYWRSWGVLARMFDEIRGRQ